MTSVSSDTNREQGIPRAYDWRGYLVVAHPEIALISRYGIGIIEFLEADKRFLRTENKIGWTRWIMKDSFLRRMRLRSPGFIKISNFLANHGQEALEAVRGDPDGFDVDFASDTIRIIPTDLLSEVRSIVNDHYRSELETEHTFEVEVELRDERKKDAVVRLLVHDKGPGRFIGQRGERVKALTSRILNEIGVNVKIVILKAPPLNGDS